MPKPTTIPTWATNPGATSDPGDARRATGFIAGRKLPAKWLNWLFAQQGGWFQYLRDLHLETEFLNKVYNWSGAHGFQGSVGMFAQAVLGGSTELQYANGAGVVTPRERALTIPLGWCHGETTTQGGDTPAWRRLNTYSTIYPGGGVAASGSTWSTGVSNRRLVAEFSLPTGCLVSGYRVGMRFTGTNPIRIETGTSAIGEAYAIFGGVSSETLEVLNVVQSNDFVPPVTDNICAFDIPADYRGSVNRSHGHNFLRVMVVTGDGTGPSTLVPTTQVNWIQVKYLDPGPRNF